MTDANPITDPSIHDRQVAAELSYNQSVADILALSTGREVNVFLPALVAATGIIATEMLPNVATADRYVSNLFSAMRSNMEKAFQLKELSNTVQNVQTVSEVVSSHGADA